MRKMRAVYIYIGMKAELMFLEDCDTASIRGSSEIL